MIRHLPTIGWQRNLAFLINKLNRRLTFFSRTALDFEEMLFKLCWNFLATALTSRRFVFDRHLHSPQHDIIYLAVFLAGRGVWEKRKTFNIFASYSSVREKPLFPEIPRPKIDIKESVSFTLPLHQPNQPFFPAISIIFFVADCFAVKLSVSIPRKGKSFTKCYEIREFW